MVFSLFAMVGIDVDNDSYCVGIVGIVYIDVIDDLYFRIKLFIDDNLAGKVVGRG